VNSKLITTEAKLVLRDLVTVPVAVGIPIALLLVFGLLPGSREVSAEFGNERAVDTVLPSMALTIAVTVLGFSVLPTYLATYREKGVLRRLATTPTTPGALLTAQVLVNLAVAVTALLIVLAVGIPVLDMTPPGNLLGFLLSYVLGVTAIFALGVFVAAVASSARAATGWGLVIFFPSMFFAGMYLPKEQMPGVLRRISDFTPAGAFRQTVQDSWAGNAPDPLLLAFLVLVVVAAGWAAARFFRWE
jgi:ABC-2 type transport system permease protein